MGKINTGFPLSLGTFIIPYRQNAEINVDASYNFYILPRYLCLMILQILPRQVLMLMET